MGKTVKVGEKLDNSSSFFINSCIVTIFWSVVSCRLSDELDKFAANTLWVVANIGLGEPLAVI